MASHGGTNLQAIMNACNQGVLNAEIKLVISNNSGSKALSRARAGNIPALHLSNLTHPDPGDLDREMKNEFASRAVDYVILAGYMRKVGPVFLQAFSGKVLNSHPPYFGNNDG
jgi:phosphoribosylglycinamide formyltransferase-1